MDLRQLARAIAAHRVVAIAGIVAAIGLAFLAQVRVDPFGDPVFSYRKPVVWTSSLTLQLTQAGFPEGTVSAQGSPVSGLAPLYASLATTDPVKRRMRAAGPIPGKVVVEPLGTDQNVLPFIRISSLTNKPSTAVSRVRRQAAAFMGYIAEQQQDNNVAPRNRVVLQVASGPTAPEVAVPRKLTLSVVVFLSMLIATGGLILALENLRRPGLADQPEDASEVHEERDGVVTTMDERAAVRALRHDGATQRTKTAGTSREAVDPTPAGDRVASEAAGRPGRWSRSSRG